MRTKNLIVLFYNTIWGESFDVGKITAPDFFTLTTDRTILCDADVVVFHMPSLDLNNEIIKADHQKWVFWSMECEQHYSHLYQSYVLELFDIFMTYKLDSDVTVSYLNPGNWANLHSPPADKPEFINCFISSSYDKSGRTDFLRNLRSFVHVDCYGRLFNNKKLTKDEGRISKMNTISSYKFTLALENAIAADYVTEKFFDPLEAGSVPVYLGAPNIEDFAPGENCFINAAGFTSVKDLAEYLIDLDKDNNRYQEFFLWRTQPFKNKFQQILDKEKTHFVLRLCDVIMNSRMS